MTRLPYPVAGDRARGIQPTSISWCDYSYNPITGCSHAGPECWNCYAERFSLRQGRTDHAWRPEHAETNVTVHYDRLRSPFYYGFPEGPGRIFVCSMSDLFHRLVPDWVIRHTIALARAFPEHVWIYLTKRPGRAAAIDVDWPANAMVGTSVGSGPGGEFADTTGRIDALREVDAPYRWVSFEPLIERVGPVDLDGIDWVVVGGESAPHDERRELDHDWALELLEQARAYDVPFFYKQDSGAGPETNPVLSVPREIGGVEVYEQRRIREFPDLPDLTRAARGDRA